MHSTRCIPLTPPPLTTLMPFYSNGHNTDHLQAMEMLRGFSSLAGTKYLFLEEYYLEMKTLYSFYGLKLFLL